MNPIHALGASSMSGLFALFKRLHPGASADQRRAASRPRQSGLGTFILAGQFALGILIAVVTGALVLDMRERAFDDAEHDLRSLALILADQADRALQAVDLVQATFEEMARTNDMRTPDDFRREMSTLEVNKLLTSHGKTLPQLDVIGLADLDGTFVNISHAWPVPVLNIGDRPYFTALKNNARLMTVVSDPLINRFSHVKTVSIVHKLKNRDGVFLGAMVAGVPMGYFESLYKTVVGSGDETVSMLRTDGVLLVRYPEPPPGSRAYDEEGAIIASQALTVSGGGNFHAPSWIDGVDRLVASHALAQYPMIVAVTRPQSFVLATWRRQSSYLIGVAVLLEALLVFVSVIQQSRGRMMVNMAHHDALTGLANRILFHQRLNEVIGGRRRTDLCAVLYIDLDHFKTVNDTLGHPIGDVLLREVTQRLLHQVRGTDLVARLGGDEFAVIQADSSSADTAAVLAGRLIEAISLPYEIKGHRIIIGASIGIALVPADGNDPDSILKAADLALYCAKAEGRRKFRFFEQEMDTRMRVRRTLEMDMRQALVRNEFQMFYQPLMNIASGNISGFEALIRWNHPERGLVSPADFIPLSEETGLIVAIGEWILLRACGDAATWPGNLKVAVNLSPVQFASPTLVRDVAAALAISGLPAHRLELEITETAMLEDTDTVLTILHELNSLGAKIALDDFGTGYSSLSYLRRFPFSKVKIDRSFISGLGTIEDCDIIVAAIIGLCERLGIITTSEGVETETQLRQLAALNCTEAQGYLFSRPRPIDDVAELCRTLTRPAKQPVFYCDPTR